MRKKHRRRPVHYTTFAYPDGAVIASSPTRKPSAKRIKEDGLTIDADSVCMEYHEAPAEFAGLQVEQRVRLSDLLANRMNMRRTIRDLVLPALADIQASLQELNQRVQQIEHSLNDSSSD